MPGLAPLTGFHLAMLRFYTSLTGSVSAVRSRAGERLRMGLMQAKTISKELDEQIIGERTQNGPYQSFQDFLRRVEPEPSQASPIP